MVARRSLFWALAVAALAAYVWFNAPFVNAHVIRSDGISYYVYLPAWIGDGDPTFETAAEACCGGFRADAIGIHRVPATGRFLAVHPMGTALLMLPFYLVAHALSWWSNMPRDGYSPYYQALVGLAGPIYLLAGVVALERLLSRHFRERTALAACAAIVFGTNLFFYAVGEPTFSHVYSFCLCAWLLLIADRWWEHPTWIRSLALGAVAALIVLVRHPNGMFLAVVPVMGITRWSDVPTRARALWDRRTHLLVAGAALFVGCLPQLLTYHWATGHFVAMSDPDGSFDFARPHAFGTLFSVERGVFFWSPVLLLAVAGLFAASGWARGLAWVMVPIVCVDAYLMASWYMWYFGNGFGHRAFVDTLPFFAVFLAVFLEWTMNRRALAWAAHLVVALCIALSCLQTWQYWRGYIPREKTTWDQYKAFFFRIAD